MHLVGLSRLRLFFICLAFEVPLLIGIPTLLHHICIVLAPSFFLPLLSTGEGICDHLHPFDQVLSDFSYVN